MGTVKDLLLTGLWAVLFVIGWLLLGVLALGDRALSPIPRTAPAGDYV